MPHSAFARVQNRAISLAQRFSADRSGAIAIIFALSLLLLITTAGGAVDYARWHSARTQMVAAMDAAVLAGGRVLQLPGKSKEEALAAARDYYDRHKPNNLSVDSITFSTEYFDQRVVARSESKISAPFLNLIGISDLELNEVTKAEIGTGRFSGSNVEVSLMLDVTASMGGTKIEDLKFAAKDLVEILIWDDQSTYQSRVALVPFAQSVDVGTHFNRVTGTSPISGNCVKERISTGDRYTDAPPTGSPFGYTGDGQNDNFGSDQCVPSGSPVVPLSSDTTLLKTRIDALTPAGNTAGHLGVGWTWNMISDKWSSVWPAGSKPGPVSHLTVIQSNGRPKLRKIAVLMTDGEFNNYYYGAPSATQATNVCDNMKATGVVVFSIAFDVSAGSSAESTMKHCATDDSHYYLATDGGELKMAFRSIGLKITTLRISE